MNETLPKLNAQETRNGSPDASPQDPPGTLYVGPLLQEVIKDLRWADKQYQQHQFDEYAGMYLAILNAKVEGADTNLGALLDSVASRHPEIERERIALFYVDSEDDF